MLRSLREFISLGRAVRRIQDCPVDRLALLKAWHYLRRRAQRPGERGCRVELGPISVRGHNYPDLLDVFEEIFADQTYRVSLPDPRPVIFDCGANIGMATLYFKLEHPTARVTCFEPNAECFALLKQNREENKLSEVTLVPAACGETEGEVTFFAPPNQTLGGSAQGAQMKGAIGRAVRQVRVSGYIQEPVQLLKLDVEGAEWGVMRDLIASGKLKLVERLIIEFHLRMHSTESNLGKFLLLLEENGYTYNIQAPARPEKRYVMAWQIVLIFAIRLDLIA